MRIAPRAGLWIGGGVIAGLSLLALLLPSVRVLNARLDGAAVPSPDDTQERAKSDPQPIAAGHRA